MSRKAIHVVSVIVIFLVLIACFFVFNGISDLSNKVPSGFITDKKESDKVISEKQPLPVKQSLIVNPTLELEQMMELYEQDIFKDAEQQTQLAQLRIDLAQQKKNGKTMWGSDKWMKQPQYYKSLKIPKLAEECFSRSIVAFETQIFDNSDIGIERLRVFHNGFAELFQRDNMWEGLLHAYDFLAEKIDTKSDFKTIVSTSGILESLASFYAYPDSKRQIAGKEKLFLSANLCVLKKYQWYIEQKQNTKSVDQNINIPSYEENALKQTPAARDFLIANRKALENLGPENSLGFFCEPCVVAQTALMLTKQLYPQQYHLIEPEIKKIIWPQKQNISDVKAFLDLIVEKLEEITQDQ